jgi:hypothetical protein
MPAERKHRGERDSEALTGLRERLCREVDAEGHHGT